MLIYYVGAFVLMVVMPARATFTLGVIESGQAKNYHRSRSTYNIRLWHVGRLRDGDGAGYSARRLVCAVRGAPCVARRAWRAQPGGVIEMDTVVVPSRAGWGVTDSQVGSSDCTNSAELGRDIIGRARSVPYGVHQRRAAPTSHQRRAASERARSTGASARADRLTSTAALFAATAE